MGKSTDSASRCLKEVEPQSSGRSAPSTSSSGVGVHLGDPSLASALLTWEWQYRLCPWPEGLPQTNLGGDSLDDPVYHLLAQRVPRQ